MADSDTVLIGRITAAHGVRGWLKIKSHTDPPENLMAYQPWLFRSSTGAPRAVRVEQCQRQGEHFIARVDGCTDRNAAEALKGTEIHVPAEALPKADADEYYWRDLIGLDVANLEGQTLGRVTGLMETGAHDVLVIDGEFGEVLVPFVEMYLERVAPEDGRIDVRWPVDWL